MNCQFPGAVVKCGMQSPAYYRRLAGLLSGYRRKKTSLSHLPLRLWLEPTARCNLACIMCPNRDLSPDRKGDMDFDLFSKVVDQARDFAFEINLCHRGESLLHPQIIPMVRYAARFPWKTKLHTNGTLLNREMARELIETGLDRLSFSFDGTCAEEYERVRVGARFERVVANIRGILQLKREMKVRLPRIVMEFIDLPGLTVADRQRMTKLIREFKELGLDQVVVKKPHNWAGAVGEPGDRRHFSPCTFLWTSLVVLWDGTVMPCTQDFFGYYPLENIRDLSLRGIWNGPRLTALRQKHATADLEDLNTCRPCDRIRRKTRMGIPVEYLRQLLTGRMP